MLTFLRTTKTSNTIKYKAHILGMRISPCSACYFHRDANIESFSSNIDDDSCLVTVPVAVVSNETSHDHNVAFTNNNKLIFFVQDINPAVDAIHFWSGGCAGQFTSKYVFCSFSYYSANVKLTWNYGETHHFKGMLNCDEIVYYNEEVIYSKLLTTKILNACNKTNNSI